MIYRSTDSANLSVLRPVLFPVEHFTSFAAKLMTGTSEVAQAMAVTLGLVALPLALVSALYKFRAPTANAVRGFV